MNRLWDDLPSDEIDSPSLMILENIFASSGWIPRETDTRNIWLDIRLEDQCEALIGFEFGSGNSNRLQYCSMQPLK